MKLFNFFKKPGRPYKDESTNLIYELLFCDDIELYKEKTQQPYIYPWDLLFTDYADEMALKEVINSDIESRVKILAYNKLAKSGLKPNNRELLAVIVEVGLESGLDVLASFKDGTARYINQTGKMIIWEMSDENSNTLTNQLFNESSHIISQIGPWDKPRRPSPDKGMVRITFLVSDGLYFGEGPVNVLFNDALAAPALQAATDLMKYLTQKTLAH